MEERPPRRSKSDLLVESALIVVSILVAFWVDASWDAFTARGRMRARLEAVRSELVDNLRVLEAGEAECARVLGANLHLITLMGPSPAAITPDSLAGLIDTSFPGTPPEMATSALQAMISAGEFAEIESPELQHSLAAWLTGSVAERRRVGALHAEQLQKTLDYLRKVMPTEHVIARNSLVDMPPSSFPLDVERVLSDPEVESVFGNLGILKSFLCSQEETDRQTVKELLDQLAAELGEGAS